MSKHAFVYSTLSAPVDYTTYKSATDGSVPQPVGSITINGGANVADKKEITPLGVMTQIDREDVEALRANSVFQMHEANGFLVIRDDKVDPEAAASELEGRDPSAPLVDADFQEPQKEEDVKLVVSDRTSARKA